MKDKILKKINNWYASGESDVLIVSDSIDYLHRKLFHDYEPAIGPKPQFDQRFSDWLENTLDEEQQKLLFRLVPSIFYVGKNEFDTLYRIAFSSISFRWLIDVNDIKFNDQLNATIDSCIHETWFCPITDSMRINQFYHLNSIKGADKRPQWRSLSAFGSTDKINDYIKKSGIKQIVLLEDFVGSGNQIKAPVEYAARTFPEINFLVIPVIMCPQAEENMKGLEANFPNVTVKPVLQLDQEYFVKKDREENPNDFFKLLFDISKSSHKKMSKSGFRSPFLGFRKIGGLIVLHTNTPNNSLPIIWSNTDWSPLFNRHVR